MSKEASGRLAGKARAASMTPEQRSALGRLASQRAAAARNPAREEKQRATERAIIASCIEKYGDQSGIFSAALQHLIAAQGVASQNWHDETAERIESSAEAAQ